MQSGVKYLFLVFQLHQLFGMDESSSTMEKDIKHGGAQEFKLPAIDLSKFNIREKFCLIPFKTIFSQTNIKSSVLMQAVSAVMKDELAYSSHVMAKKRLMSKKRYKKDVTLLSKLINARRQNSAGSSFYEIFRQATDEELRSCFDPKKGWNALHFAAFGGNVSICRKLIEELRLNPLAPDKNGMIPKRVAEKNERRNTVLYLKQYDSNP